MPYEDVYVQCPFYVRSNKKLNKIKCQWLIDGAELILRFTDKQDFNIQMDTFCQNKYKNCELYRMLSHAYEEEPNDQ